MRCKCPFLLLDELAHLKWFYGKRDRSGQVCVDFFCDLKTHLWSPLPPVLLTGTTAVLLVWPLSALRKRAGSRARDQLDYWAKRPCGLFAGHVVFPSHRDLGKQQGLCLLRLLIRDLVSIVGHSPGTSKTERCHVRNVGHVISTRWMYSHPCMNDHVGKKNVHMYVSLGHLAVQPKIDRTL